MSSSDPRKKKNLMQRFMSNFTKSPRALTDEEKVTAILMKYNRAPLMKDIMEDPLLLHSFTKFTTRRCQHENVFFIQAVHEFKAQCDSQQSDEKEIDAQITSIYETFIADDAQLGPLNLPCGLPQFIGTCCKQKQLDKLSLGKKRIIFDDAKASCDLLLKLNRGDWWRAYTTTRNMPQPHVSHASASRCAQPHTGDQAKRI